MHISSEPLDGHLRSALGAPVLRLFDATFLVTNRRAEAV